MEITFDTPEGLKLYLTKEVADSDKAICVIAHDLCEHSGRYDVVPSVRIELTT